jgi:hypothetical protein
MDQSPKSAQSKKSAADMQASFQSNKGQSTGASFAQHTRSLQGGGGYNMVTTTPDHILRHDISDEEMTILMSGDNSSERDVLLTAIGIAVGAVAPAMSAIAKFRDGKEALNGLDLVQSGIFVAAAVVALVMAFVRWKSPHTAANLAAAIRQRKIKNAASERSQI